MSWLAKLLAPGAVALSVTVAAPALAGPFTWPHVPERIAEGLGSSDVTERRGAARRLSDLGREIALPLVRQALADPDVEVRLSAAAAAVRHELPDGGDRVVGWIGESDARLRAAACNVARVAPSRGAVSALGRALADASADVRGLAAIALGASGFAEAVSPLLGHVDDASPEVRGEVVRSLGRLRDARSVLPLVGRLQDSAPEVRRAAARALRELGDVRATSALVVALGDAVPAVRLEAVEALGELRSPEAVLSLVPLAHGGSPTAPAAVGRAPRGEATEQLRAAALRALARIPDPRAIDAIVAALPLDDPDAGDVARDAPGPARPTSAFVGAAPTSARRAPLGSATPAADALIAAGPSAAPALVVALRGGLGPRATTSAARALAEVDPQAAVPAIGRAILAGALPVRAGLSALGRTRRPEALPSVLERLDDQEALVRASALAAALAIVEQGRTDGRLVDPVVASLRDARRPPEERVALVRLLGQSGSPRAHPTLVALLAPPRPAPGEGARSAASREQEARREPLRVAAVEALGALGIGSEAADRALLAALDDESPRVRRAAATALSRAGSAGALGELLRRLTQEAEQDRAAIAVALSGVASRTQDEGAGELLAAALARAPRDVRDGLLEALGRASGETARAALLEAAAAPDPDDRRKVAEALAERGEAAGARAVVTRMLEDPDASVRAAAAWSLGRAGDRASAERLAKALSDPDVAVASNAAASLARIAQRLRAPALAAPTLCRLVDDRRAYVAVNALAGLSLLGAPCDVARAAAALSGRRAAVVRAAAARWLAARRGASGGEGEVVHGALARCLADERDVAVAEACDGAPAELSKGPRSSLLVFVIPDGGAEPRARAPFALARPDGLVRSGLADRRGAVLEGDLPPGEVHLEVPAALLP